MAGGVALASPLDFSSTFQRFLQHLARPKSHLMMRGTAGASRENNNSTYRVVLLPLRWREDDGAFPGSSSLPKVTWTLADWSRGVVESWTQWTDLVDRPGARR